MEEKTIGILVHFDPYDTTHSSGAVRTDNKKNLAGTSFKIPNTDETYIVFMNNNPKDNLAGESERDSQLDGLAHELGHVLSSIFRIPGGMQDDPRAKGEFRHMCCAAHAATPKQAEAIFHNEKLAWEIARKIRPEINPESERQALATYDPDSPHYGGN
jgi:hypothetical protein